ncbi:MAG: asparagine synthase (glutamine-hydrolyzing) [Candidatus Acidiferrales bacterium]
MCGIVGFTHLHKAGNPELLRSALLALSHRGPDQQRGYESGTVSLGAARLKIIDLETGDQPMYSEDGDTVLVYNGEVYNHAELRAELQALGHRFRTTSDTEVVLHAFLEWDKKSFSKLRGMFAIAVWTESEKRLVLARDRMGIKPLYLHRRGEDIFFGSELKTIFIHPEVERQLDLDALNCFLSLSYVPGPYTLVEGIEKLKPGFWLEWRNGRVHSESYWRLAIQPRAEWTLEPAKQELDSLLAKSVREHVISDVPLGIWISGGLDSSTILHYAAQESSKPLKTFSICFRGRSFDEAAYIHEIAERYGTDHVDLDLNPEVDLQDAIEHFATYSDEPCADAGALPVWFLSMMSREKVTVALSGEGADELFGGYLTYRADQYARPVRRIPLIARGLSSRMLQHWPVSDDKISFEYKAKRFLEGCKLSAQDAHVFWNGALSEAEKESIFFAADPSPLHKLLNGMPRDQRSAGYLTPYLWFDQKYFLPDDILTKVDRMSMAHSLEVRPPFLDHRIVEFAASLPERYKIRGFCQKYLLRELMRDKLPNSIIGRKKIGLDIPAHQWLRGPLRTLLRDTLSATAVRQTGLFRASGIESLIRRHMERRANLGYQLWSLMILFLWMNRWNIQSAPALEEIPETERIAVEFSQ